MNNILEIDGIKLDTGNKQFFQAAEHVRNSNKNIIYLTGKAGSGKTTFLKYIRQTYQGIVVVLSPTGVAAVNAHGQTIHSFFGLENTPYPPGDQRLQVPQIYERLSYRSEKKELITNLSLLIIDEVSMLRCDILDAIDTILRIYRKNQAPFGGVKVLLIGDLFQLPPIAQPLDWTILGQYYKSKYFFDSYVYKRSSSTYIELEKPYRQTELEFIDILNKVRVNQLSGNDLRRLNSRYSAASSKGSIFLTARNFDVESYNEKEYNELRGQEYVFNAQTVGIFNDSMKLVKDHILLKVGARVMIMKNKYNKQLEEFEYYNGSIGTITAIDKDSKWITVKLSTGEVTVYPVTWENIEFIWNPKTKESETKILGTYTQLPVKLAWAITIHKSQGLTFDEVTVDLNSCFDTGQVYVALSRCREFKGLHLKTPLLPSVIKVDQNVINFSKNRTPDTMIINEIEAGKADKIYKECRKAFDDNDPYKLIAFYKEAIKVRDDFDTPLFNKYIKVKLNLFHAYKAKCDDLFAVLAEKDGKLNDVETALIGMKNNIHFLTEKLTIAVHDNKELQQENLSLQQSIQGIQSAYDNLKLELEHSEMEREKLNEKINLMESSHDEQMNSLNYELAWAKDDLSEANKEIERLRNLKWYQKLFGKE